MLTEANRTAKLKVIFISLFFRMHWPQILEKEESLEVAKIELSNPDLLDLEQIPLTTPLWCHGVQGASFLSEDWALPFMLYAQYSLHQGRFVTRGFQKRTNLARTGSHE